jgi:phosphatidylserine/phosphatidylglycerophosphate/cardiolipin synthase-like enzyme
MAFSFTRRDLTDILLERASAGVSVQGVFERRQISAGADAAWVALSGAGLPSLEVRQDGNRYNLHTKAFIVDEAIVIAGSYNFSRNAEEQNNENVLILHSPEVAAAFTAEWHRIWAAGGR